MKKIFRLQDLDCAHCAQKMENAIKKLDGVTDAHVDFINQKMTIEADDDKINDILVKTKTVCAKIEPDCKILGI